MSTAGALDEVQILGRDLSTVVGLLCGSPLSAAVSETLVAEALEGACTERHEAVVYLLATHLLVLDERPRLDHLAWRWLGARSDGAVRVREASDALRLAVFAVESGWPAERIRRLVALVGLSRETTGWVDLSDLARHGGRHACALAPLVDGADLWSSSDPCRAAALHALCHAHELHQITPAVGCGFAALGHAASDVRCATLFTESAGASSEALAAVWGLVRSLGLRHAIHAFPGGVRRLEASEPRSVVPLGALSDQVLEDASRPHALRSEGAANLPSVLAMPPDQVLGVFPSGHRLVRDARWWAAGRRPRQAR